MPSAVSPRATAVRMPGSCPHHHACPCGELPPLHRHLSVSHLMRPLPHDPGHNVFGRTVAARHRGSPCGRLGCWPCRPVRRRNPSATGVTRVAGQLVLAAKRIRSRHRRGEDRCVCRLADRAAAANGASTARVWSTSSTAAGSSARAGASARSSRREDVLGVNPKTARSSPGRDGKPADPRRASVRHCGHDALTRLRASSDVSVTAPPGRRPDGLRAVLTPLPTERTLRTRSGSPWTREAHTLRMTCWSTVPPSGSCSGFHRPHLGAQPCLFTFPQPLPHGERGPNAPQVSERGPAAHGRRGLGTVTITRGRTRARCATETPPTCHISTPSRPWGNRRLTHTAFSALSPDNGRSPRAVPSRTCKSPQQVTSPKLMPPTLCPRYDSEELKSEPVTAAR